MMKFIRHKGSASTIQNIQNIQYIHILENKNTGNKKYNLKHSDAVVLVYVASSLVNEDEYNISLR